MASSRLEQKAPLGPTKACLFIRTTLQVEERTRHLTIYNLAIDSELRGGGVVACCASDAARSSHAPLEPLRGPMRPCRRRAASGSHSAHGPAR